MNMQNYRVILVKDPKLIKEVRNAQEGGNIKKSQNAIPVVFCSDLKPRNNFAKYVEMCKRGSIPDSFVNVVKQSSIKYISNYI